MEAGGSGEAVNKVSLHACTSCLTSSQATLRFLSSQLSRSCEMGVAWDEATSCHKRLNYRDTYLTFDLEKPSCC